LFETSKTTMQVLARNLTKLLDQFGLRKQTIVYVKNKRSNLITMTNAFKYVVCYETLGLEESF
jgi:hypothetical protein